MREYAGDDRYMVSSMIVSVAMEGEAYRGVIVASGEDGKFADALSASALSGLLNYPILLVDGQGLTYDNRRTLMWLSRAISGPLDIIAVGGQDTISPSAVGELSSYGSVTRIDGADRYALSQNVYLFGREHGGWDGERVIVAKGNDFPDALSMAPYASAYRAPILLVDQHSGKLDAQMRDILEGFSEAIVLGGEESVGAALYRDIENTTKAGAVRLGGSDRYEAAVSIAAWELEHGMTTQGMGFATGAKFTDALSSGFLLGKTNSILMIVDGTAPGGNDDVLRFLRTHGKGTDLVSVFGGEASIVPQVRSDIRSALGW